MEFKSAKDMSFKIIKNKNIMTLEQSNWISDLKLNIKNELDKVYEESPHVGFVSVYMSINQNILIDVNVDGYFYQIKDIENHLKRLGYKVSTDFLYDRRSKLADSYYINISWEV